MRESGIDPRGGICAPKGRWWLERRDRAREPPAVGDPAPGAPLLDVEHLQIYFPIKAGLIIDRKVGQVHAVDDASLSLSEGETLGVVGECGCGKTTLIRALVRLIPASGGAIRFRGQDITTSSRATPRTAPRACADYSKPIHPYTAALLSTIPVPDPENRARARAIVGGEPPNPINPPPGCRFHPRCPHATDICHQVEPPWWSIRAATSPPATTRRT